MISAQVVPSEEARWAVRRRNLHHVIVCSWCCFHLLLPRAAAIDACNIAVVGSMLLVEEAEGIHVSELKRDTALLCPAHMTSYAVAE